MAPNVNGDKLVEMAMAAYGVDKKFVVGSAYDKQTETATIVTAGGSKVSFKEGDKVEPLRPIAITGINPEAAKRKVIAGKEKK